LAEAIRSFSVYNNFLPNTWLFFRSEFNQIFTHAHSVSRP